MARLVGGNHVARRAPVVHERPFSETAPSSLMTRDLRTPCCTDVASLKVENESDWNRDAQPERWLGSHEVVRWRGRPNASKFFARQDLYLIPIIFVWIVLVVVFVGSSQHGELGRIFSIVWAIVTGYLIFGRHVTKRFMRRNLRYAVTNERVVEIRCGQILHSGTLDAQYRVERQRNGRSGSILWWVDPLGPGSSRIISSRQLALVQGTGFPGAERFRQTLAFFDVDGIDAALECLNPAADLARVSATAAIIPTPVVTGPPVRFGVFRRVFRRWFGKTSYRIDMSIPANVAAQRLAQNLKSTLSVRWQPSDHTIRGRVKGNSVLIWGYVVGNNSWRRQFRGRIRDTSTGSILEGTISPGGFTTAFSAVWCAPLVIFLVVLIWIFLQHLFTGQLTYSFLRGTPIVFLPLGFLTFFSILTEVATRSAVKGWLVTDRWLRDLLTPEEPTISSRSVSS
jgi:hypothetical protein